MLGFRVAGLPIPQGSKTASVVRGRAVIRDDNAKTLKPWRRRIKDIATAHLPPGWRPLNEPVRVVLLFAMPRPKSHPKRRRLWPIGRGTGDIDKLTRAVLDALEDARVLLNDSVVVDLRAIKDYPGPDVEQAAPGVLVAVFRVVEPADALPIPEGST